ncbi:MAG: DUF2070 family protein [Nitrososphaeria archaeon]
MVGDATSQIANHYKKLFRFPPLRVGVFFLVFYCIILSLPFYRYGNLNMFCFLFLSFFVIISVIAVLDTFLTSFSLISSFRRLLFANLFQFFPLLLFSILSSIIIFLVPISFNLYLKMFTFWMLFTINLRYFILYAIFYQNHLYSIIHSLIFLLPFSIILLYLNKYNISFDFIIFVLAINLFFTIIVSMYIKFIDKVGFELLNFSSFKILVSYLYSWVCAEPSYLESILEYHSVNSEIETYQIEFINDNKKLYLVVPGIHPGPFAPIGSYNLPYEIINFYKLQNINSIVFHSPSSHDVNLPSKQEVKNYLFSLKNGMYISKGSLCTKPVRVCKNKVTATGLKFGDIILVFITFAPYGIEDLPSEIYAYVKEFETNGIKKVILIDSHNALGPLPSSEDVDDLKNCLSELIKKIKEEPVYTFKYNFIQKSFPEFKEIGPAGASCLLLLIDNCPFVIYSIDSNNATPQIRSFLEEELQKKGLILIEICTTDSHFSSGKVLSEKGYYALGELSDYNCIISQLVDMATKLLDSPLQGVFKSFYCKSNQKILGHSQIDAYSRFLNITLTRAKRGALILFLLSILLFASTMIFYPS